ncbi:MAG: glucose-6-phosphate isomerase [Oligoflexia bacterium]|nr:glucose-6-phosphate isomerase [Oligoflexia bacterium]
MALSISFNGLKNKEFDFSNLGSDLDAFKEIINDEKYGFFHVTDRKELLDQCKAAHQKFSQFKTFVQVGIGGSSLGPEMLISALQKNDVHFEFLNNIDPDKIHQQLSNINLKETLFYFVSKSGGTAETMASLAIVVNELKKLGVEKEDLKKQFIFATDPLKSDLLNLGRELGIETLEIPSNVGGRFSVFTPVGYLPAIFAGIDIEGLASGANDLKEELLKSNSDFLKATQSLFELKEKENINQTVLMPYSSKLRDLSFWFVQLWAESLGKKLNKNGEVVETGFTPIPGYGATDQHSQVQLFMEGTRDKIICLIEVEKFANDYSLANDLDVPALKRLNNSSLAQLMKAELEGTMKALEAQNRPYLLFKIEELNEVAIGELVLLFESMTALMGHKLNIDPFDQPGVEAGKIFAFEWLAQLK